jgi:hypothetical protein
MSRILGVKLHGTGRIEPAHVGCLVAPEDSRRIVWMIKRHPMPAQMASKQTATALG